MYCPGAQVPVAYVAPADVDTLHVAVTQLENELLFAAEALNV
jgi:hypothetical protein